MICQHVQEEDAMSNNKEHARRLKELGYERKAIAFKLFDEVPKNAVPY